MKRMRKDISGSEKDYYLCMYNYLTKVEKVGVILSRDLLTSCVWIMEVGVQAFFQRP